MISTYVSLIILVLARTCASFNIAPEAVGIFRPPPPAWPRDNYFGFSVGLVYNTEENTYFLVVGAPRSNSSSNHGINEPGAMFKCDVRYPEKLCNEVIVDAKDNGAYLMDYGETLITNRDHSWNGAALDVNSNEDTVICAPRWKTQPYRSKYSLRMNGFCSVVDSRLKDYTAKSIHPLTNADYQIYHFEGYSAVVGVYFYGFGQAGMSIYFPSLEPEYLVLGGPGILNWQGATIKMTPSKQAPSRSEEEGGSQRTLVTYKNPFVPNPIYTHDNADFSLFGYAISMGYFWLPPGGRKRLYVAGAPRGGLTHGQVFVYDLPHFVKRRLSIVETLTGVQLGEYFGAALSTPDLNGDGLSDVVVGAPLYSARGFPDMGCIYVFINNYKEEKRLSPVGQKLVGRKVGGARFGTSISHPGDIDQDGYDDVLVGAPYETDEENVGRGSSSSSSSSSGVVYLFMGNEYGIRSKYAQRLTPSVVSKSIPMKGFGMSFTRFRDIDDNHFPDIGIGSFESGHVALMLSRPVITLSGHLSSDPETLTLSTKEFRIRACVVYQGNVSEPISGITLRFSLRQSGEGTFVYFRDSSGHNHVVEVIPKEKENCITLTVDVKVKNNDGSPIRFQMEAALTSTDLLPKIPVVNPFVNKKTSSLTVSFVNGCQNDGDPTCSSDLVTAASLQRFDSSKGILVGERRNLTIQVTVLNKMEPAFLPYVTITVPSPIDFLPWKFDCGRQRHNQTASLTCQLRNPLLDEQIIEVDLDISRLTLRSPYIYISVEAGSVADFEVNPLDNSASISLEVRGKASISISGWSSPERSLYDRLKENQMDTNGSLQFSHTSTIAKHGVTPLGTVEVRLHIPEAIIATDDRSRLPLIQVLDTQILLDNQPQNCRVQKRTSVFEYRKTQLETYNNNTFSNGDGGTSPVDIDCNSERLECAEIFCNVGPWKKASQIATLLVSFQINLTSLSQIIDAEAGGFVVSYTEAKISSINDQIELEGDRFASTSIITNLIPRPLAEGFAWWGYFLAILGGLLLILLISFGLYEIGFFKRKKMEELKEHKANIIQATETE